VGNEREAKLIASAQVRLPDLDGVVTGVSAAAVAECQLDAVYYDTAELDLVRWGITLSHGLRQ
jgi:inorganic triphosphatase YgiF